MSSPKRKRDVPVLFWVSADEMELIQQKMAQFGTKNLSAYLRKMAVDGYVVQLDLPELKELVSLLRRSSNNLNQLTRKVHETGRIYDVDLEDAKAKLPANVFTYTFGIIAALVAGVGMCLSMKVIGSGSTAMFVLGVIVGIIGLLGMGVNYPIYKKMLAQGKQKYAFEIMELAKEISEM